VKKDAKLGVVMEERDLAKPLAGPVIAAQHDPLIGMDRHCQMHFDAGDETFNADAAPVQANGTDAAVSALIWCRSGKALGLTGNERHGRSTALRRPLVGDLMGHSLRPDRPKW